MNQKPSFCGNVPIEQYKSRRMSGENRTNLKKFVLTT